MKELNIVAKISVCVYEELNEIEKNLIDVAKNATQSAYSPYSKFQVGAAILLNNNEIVTGSNQENAAYPLGLCAERVAIFSANSQFPAQAVKAIAVAAFTNGQFTEACITPCGGCRQVILETQSRYKTPIRMLLYGEKEIYVIENVQDLLPLSFNKSQF